jgi:hypothetical protein
MSTSESMTVDVQAWIHLNCLDEGGFPALLWDSLKDFGYTTYPEFSARVLHDHRPTASLGSEGEDPHLPSTSYLGRVGG